jgi:hypothetical protein
MAEHSGDETDDVPGCGIAALALTAAGILIAAGITVVSDLGSAYPYVLLVTLFIVAVTGVPAFAAIRERPTWQNIAIAGFVVGAIFPAVFGLPMLTQPTDYFAGIGGFGVAGIVGAMIVWLLIRWLQNSGLIAVAGVSLLVVVGAAAMWAVPWALMDRSCHNPLRDGGRSIGSVAGFDLRLPMSEWRAVEAEVERFADESDWEIRADVRPDYDFPWFQISMCSEAGTNILVLAVAPDKNQLAVSVFQPQGGESWQAPLKRLQDRLERRWPARIGYDENTPRLPWVPSSPQPSNASLPPP